MGDPAHSDLRSSQQNTRCCICYMFFVLSGVCGACMSEGKFRETGRSNEEVMNTRAKDHKRLEKRPSAGR